MSLDSDKGAGIFTTPTSHLMFEWKRLDFLWRDKTNYFEIDHSSFGGNDAVVCWCCKEPCFISTLPKQLKVQWNKLEYQVWLAMRTCLASNLVEKSSCSLTIMMSRRGWCSVKELVLQSAVPIFLHKQHDLSLNGKEHCSAMTSRLFVGNVLLVMTLTPTKLSANRLKKCSVLSKLEEFSASCSGRRVFCVLFLGSRLTWKRCLMGGDGPIKKQTQNTTELVHWPKNRVVAVECCQWKSPGFDDWKPAPWPLPCLPVFFSESLKRPRYICQCCATDQEWPEHLQDSLKNSWRNRFGERNMCYFQVGNSHQFWKERSMRGLWKDDMRETSGENFARRGENPWDVEAKNNMRVHSV